MSSGNECKTDYLVCGGGVVGLAIANELKARQPRASVLVLEKEPALASHASGRNSGVLHAGFYYSPDSLKAQLTRDGNRLLREFCEAHEVPVRSCGKVVVAKNSEELPRLDELLRRGRANGVYLEEIDARDLARIEPMAQTHERAIWSPTTGVADPSRVTTALGAAFVAAGGELLLNCRVLDVSGDIAKTNQRNIKFGHLVNTAGLYADRVAAWFGLADDYALMPFKGIYLYAPSLRNQLRAHVYPVPDPRNPFLGVHATLTVNGDLKIGPTAIPVLSRENYSVLSGLRWPEFKEVVRDLPAFLRSPHHDAIGLIRSEVPKYFNSVLVREARKLMPALDVNAFTVRGTPGIRAQLFDRHQRRLEMDFVVRQTDTSTHILNAVSPAWTSSIAFAKYVAAGMESRGVL